MLLVLAVWGATALGAAPKTVECVTASENAQRQRDEFKFRDARLNLLKCVDERCPQVVKADCAKWLAQLQTDQPSIVVTTRVGGRDWLEVPSIAFDGVPVELKLGQPLDVDPGKHEIEVTLPDGRSNRQPFVAAVGERNRQVVFSFEAAVSPDAPVVAAAPATAVTPNASSGPRPIELTAPAPAPSVPPSAIALTAGAVAAGVTFGILAGLGRAELGKVESQSCAATKSCDPASLGTTRSLYLGADIALGVGVVLAGLAVWRWLAW